MQFPLLRAVSLSSFLSAVSVSVAADSSYSRCRGGTLLRSLSSEMRGRFCPHHLYQMPQCSQCCSSALCCVLGAVSLPFALSFVL